MTPRTITSMALANSSMNLFCRRFVSRATIQRGRPNVPTKAAEQRHDDRQVRRRQPDDAATRTAASRRSRSRTSAATISRPARCRRRRMVTFSRAFCALLQLLQRLGDLPAAVLDGVRLRLDGDARGPCSPSTPWMRLSVRRSPEKIGVDQQIDDGADRQRRQQQQAGEQEIVAIHARLPWGCRVRRAPRRLDSACGQARRLAVVLGALPEARARDAGGAVAADDACRARPRR